MMKHRQAKFMVILLLIVVVLVSLFTGCKSPTKEQIIAGAVATLQTVLGADVAAVGTYMQNHGYTGWPADVAGLTALGQTLVAAVQSTKPAVTPAASIAAAIAPIETKDGSGEDLLKAFHAGGR